MPRTSTTCPKNARPGPWWAGKEGGPQKDLLIKDNQVCNVSKGTHGYRNVHIWNGGKLIFSDEGEHIHFWATAILVEKDGSLLAGSERPHRDQQAGTGELTIHLYGAPQNTKGKGVRCQTGDMCGVPADIWNSNVDDHGHPGDPAVARKVSNPAFATSANDYRGPKDDYFYAYHPLFHDEGDLKAYFGYKVLGVSHGGTLELYGKKGACAKVCAPLDDGRELGPSEHDGEPRRTRATRRRWSSIRRSTGKKDDWIVVTTTDYLPGHSELLQIAADTNNGTTVAVKQKVKHHHNGARYPIPSDAVSRLGLSSEVAKGAETRAAVALLSRSIRIVSAGSALNEDFPLETFDRLRQPPSGDQRQVLFRRPHRRSARDSSPSRSRASSSTSSARAGGSDTTRCTSTTRARPNPDTFVVDSSIWDSMTRWIVLHGTQDVTLARNVGYKSIGHGFYLEDGTEINNRLFANIGIFARAAVNNKQNPRKVPGILAAPDWTTDRQTSRTFPYKSDYDHPTVFWIMNGWNDFQYNMAAGAGTCGACYWLVRRLQQRDVADGQWEGAAVGVLRLLAGQRRPGGDDAAQVVHRQLLHLGHDIVPDHHQDRGVHRRGPKPERRLSARFRTSPIRSRPRRWTRARPRLLSQYRRSGGRFPTQCGGPLADPHADCRSVAAAMQRGGQSRLSWSPCSTTSPRPSTGRRSTSRRSGCARNGTS